MIFRRFVSHPNVSCLQSPTYTQNSLADYFALPFFVLFDCWRFKIAAVRNRRYNNILMCVCGVCWCRDSDENFGTFSGFSFLHFWCVCTQCSLFDSRKWCLLRACVDNFVILLLFFFLFVWNAIITQTKTEKVSTSICHRTNYFSLLEEKRKKEHLILLFNFN